MAANRPKKLKRRRTVLEDGPREMDVHVGQRLRYARTLRGMTQTDLASAVGLTFQQLQKYERGMNRVSASKLWQFSQVFGVSVEWFFAGQTSDAARQNISSFAKRETLELVRCYSAAPPEVKSEFLSFVKTVAKQK